VASDEQVRNPRGWTRTAGRVVVAALVGATAVMYAMRLVSDDLPVRVPPVPPSSPSSGPTSGQAQPCTGGADPARAAVVSLKAPATPEGAAEAAAGVVRFVLSTRFGETDVGPATIQAIAAEGRSAQLEDLQRSQAPIRQRLITSSFHPGHGAYAVTADPVKPTVTLVAPWSRHSADGQETVWTFYDVELVRKGDWWAVVSAKAPTAPDGLAQLGGADATSVGLTDYEAALRTAGFRRYAAGTC
jgi:hypothetical protein